MGFTKEQLLARLKELEIDFTCYPHPVVLTVGEQAKYVGHLGGELSKNLFLKDKKHRLYIVSALAGTKIDMKTLSMRLGLGKAGLRMAPEENLQEVLQVPLGCVTPFALINESASAVSLLLDQGWKAQSICYFHPLTNDMTIALTSSNLDKFLISIGKQPAYVDLEACPVVDKDNPPDLANLVPCGVQSVSNSVETSPVNVPHHSKVPQKETCAPEAKDRLKDKNKSRIDQSDDRPDATNVDNFVTNVFEIISPYFLSEISKKLNIKPEQLPSSILDGVQEHATEDLENMTIGLRNAAYTSGFLAGHQSFLMSGLNGLPSRD